MTIWFDMDNTICALYDVPNWLDYLRKENTYPYEVAAPMLDFSKLAKILCYLQLRGWKLGIISWTTKGGSEPYNLAVEMAKRAWLARYLPSVEWDEIKIVRYGTNKHDACGGGILFDDEEGNRRAWGSNAYTPDEIIKVLKMLAGG